MKVLGYIVQFYDEDSVAPHGTGKQLFREFQDAKSYAITMAREWYAKNYEPIEGPVEWHEISKDLLDTLKGALVFTSSNVLIWIEVVYEI